ncbi:helix-turn-helix domain-containing protein [Klebsiella pneumoniae subsp. pneumoniae]|nr:helix-turn-helix domain-containing protein [Klebsiella pneumoniae subsp. pneumoniae]
MKESFHGEIDARYAGSLKVSTVTAAGVNLYRTRNEIKRDNDAWFYTVFQLAGEAIIEQDDRQVTLAAGDITLIDAARPCSIVWQQTLASGLAAAAAPAGGAHRGHHYRLPAGQISANGPAQPATAAGKHGRHDALRQRERSRAGGDRLPVAPGAASARSCPFRREKQFQKIIALIDASIQSEHLRPEWLASETGMSVRSLYRLFADQGLVVAQYIKNRRLDLCAQALQNVHDDEKLAGSATAGASATTAIFSTAFKQRFGVTPGEYRKRCR